jgi:hypothetical protein
MDESARREWLAVAWDTLKDIEPELLAKAARNARKLCDHPSKIVPTIVAEVDELTRYQRELEAICGKTRPATQLPAPPKDVCTPEQARQIMAEFGLKRNPLDLAEGGLDG